MPLYEYECLACGHRFERIQKFSDPAVEECPSCGERNVQKLLSSPAIQFKGTGWYVTDYAKKGAAATDAKAPAATDAAKDSPGSKESKESRESKESKESKSSAPSSGPTSTPKASGE